MLRPKFSVLMSVYIKDNPAHLNEAIYSIVNQTVLPSEIVIILDGPISDESMRFINSYKNDYPGLFQLFAQEKNLGLGTALGIGVQHCKYELIARMDSDDISAPDRFEKQIDFMVGNPHIAVLGSNIEEFDSKVGDLKRYRIMPEKGDKLIKYAKQRSPVNHPSIMLRKSAVLDSGNYQGDILLFEDYSLFVRLLLKGYEFYNLQQVLLYFRIGDGLQTIKRRSGWHYIKSESRFLFYVYRLGYLNFFDLVKSLSMKVPIRLLPSSIVLKLYSLFLRTDSK